MSKAIMLSIQPKYCELIASGKKTIEVRKTRPKLEVQFKCYIYKTKSGKYGCDYTCPHYEHNQFYSDCFDWNCERMAGRGAVIGEFMCDYIKTFEPFIDIDERSEYYFVHHQETCLNYKEFREYGNGKPLYGLHISDLVIYDKPKKLGEFRTPKNIHRIGNSHSWVLDGYKKITRPFQSWGYVELLED